jgi:hypothetical protein
MAEHDLNALDTEIRELLRVARTSMFEAEKPAKQRKYSYSRSNNELGYRIVLGQDPARVPEDKLEEIDPLASRTLRSLINDGDCPLRRIKVGGSTYVTEVAVRQYERHLERGAPAYQNPSPRP